MPRKNNIEEIAILNQELEYSKYKEFTSNLFSRENEKVFTKRAKIIIFKKIQKLDLIVDESIKNELTQIIDSLITNNMTDIVQLDDIKIVQNISNRKQLKDLKQKLDFPQRSAYMKVLFNKELVTLAKKKSKLEKTLELISNKNNYFYNKLRKRKEIKIIKNKLRTRDVKSFIKNRSTYKKVYLSDDPPLTPMAWIKLLLSYGFMLLWALIILWPLAELVKVTFNNDASTYLNVDTYSFGFSSFNRLFTKTDFTSWLTNTIFVAGITAAITVFMALLMGYAFSRFRFRGKRMSLLSVMLLQMVPTMASLTVFYVIYTILNQQFQISGLTVLIIIYIGGGVAGNTFIMKGYMDSISLEIDEAAKIDGLSQWKIFTRIIVPLTKPMIALVALWSFIGPFGDFILPGLLLSEPKDYTLAKGLNSLINDPDIQDQGAFAAGSIIIAMPIAGLFIALRKFLVGGITAGGVKG